MKSPTRLTFLLCLALLTACGNPSETSGTQDAANPALTITVTTPQTQAWPNTLDASGNIAAWQEAVIGAELGGHRITEVLSNVGDTVTKGQVLARIANDTVSNDLAEARAALAEAEATLAEANSNLARSQRLEAKGFYSPQQAIRDKTVADAAQARRQVAKARLQSAEIRHAKAEVRAPDNGILSARIATVGSMSEQGKELFRLIRGGRLEWRAEVTAAELHRLQVGQSASLTLPGGQTLTGKVRIVSPAIDPQTRTGLVYVDLPKEATSIASAGMFARGTFALGEHPAITLPRSAILLREGFAYVFLVEPLTGDLAKVRQQKVSIGRQQAHALEVLDLSADSPVVASGAGFLSDGDTVRRVAANP